jgi:Trypsin-co-occurring domain 2
VASLKDASQYLSLSEALNSLKAELLKADAAAEDNDDALLEFRECEIELSLEFKPNVGAEFNAGIFKIKAGAAAAGGHKIRVKYKSLRPLVASLEDEGNVAPTVLGPATRIKKGATRKK